MGKAQRANKITAEVAYLIKMAIKWLNLELEDADREYVENEHEKVTQTFISLEKSNSAPWLTQYLRSKKTTRIWSDKSPRYLTNVLMLDLSSAYKKRFQIMGESDGRCATLRDLFHKPCSWFLSRCHTYKCNINMIKVRLEKVFGGIASSKLEKEFYTRFYGMCTKKWGKKLRLLRSIGELALRQNTLHVVQQELKIRDNKSDHAILMIQTDSLTLCKSALKNHRILGMEAWRASTSALEWDHWIASELSEPGVAEWRVDATPQYAIFPGVVNKYAFMHAAQIVSLTNEDGWSEVKAPVLDVRPRSMLVRELANEDMLSAAKASQLLRQALENGPSCFPNILAEIPHTIRYKDCGGKIIRKKPSLRLLLEPFVKGCSSGLATNLSKSADLLRASRATYKLSAFERAIALSEAQEEPHYVVGKEFAGGARKFEIVRDRSVLPNKGTWHEYFTGTVRAFAEYDPDKESPLPLPESVLPRAVASLVSFFHVKMQIEVFVEVMDMTREDKPFGRHIVFRIAHKETLNECFFWDPKDIKEALGEVARYFDPKPWCHRKCLRLPGCKKINGEGAYIPVNGDDLNNADVYEKYCVCVAPTSESILYGARPVVDRASATLHNELFFPSEKILCTALIRLLKHLLGGDYSVFVDKCQLCNKTLEANCVWQRIKVVCVKSGSMNHNKLLDLRVFCEKFLYPWFHGAETAKVSKLLHHHSNNSYVLWKFTSVQDGMLFSANFRCFHETSSTVFTNAARKKSQITFSDSVVRKMLQTTGVKYEDYQKALLEEEQKTFTIPVVETSPGTTKVFATFAQSCNVHGARKAIRSRLRAQRHYGYIGKMKTKRGQDQTKRDQEKVRMLTSTRSSWDTKFAFSIAVAIAALHAPDKLAARVSEREYTYAVSQRPSYYERVDKYITKVRERRGGAPKLDGTITAWLSAVYS